MEEKAALISGLANRGLRNVTTFVPRCGFDHSFRCNQEWSAVGLSWQVDREGRMVDKTLTKGTPKCPLQKGNSLPLPGKSCQESITRSVILQWYCIIEAAVSHVRLFLDIPKSSEVF